MPDPPLYDLLGKKPPEGHYAPRPKRGHECVLDAGKPAPRVLQVDRRRRTWTAVERARVRDATGGRCATCDEELSAFEVDHVRPLSEGGKDEPANLQA
jgi:hypothetical protein